MVSLSAASPLRLTISPPTWTTTSCPEKGVQHNGTDSEHPGNRPPWHLACLSIGFFVWLVQGISNDHKREKREKEQASRDLEYHEKRMKELK